MNGLSGIWKKNYRFQRSSLEDHYPEKENIKSGTSILLTDALRLLRNSLRALRDPLGPLRVLHGGLCVKNPLTHR
jgi:hypothetical protein